MTLDAKKIQWYKRLVPPSNPEDIRNKYRSKSLQEVFGLRILLNKIVVCYETEEKKRVYAALDSHIDLYNLISRNKPKDRRFHEVFLGGACQKPRFDIDIKDDELPDGYTGTLEEFGEMIKDRVITSVIITLRYVGVELNLNENLVICTSHSPPVDQSSEKRKCSYHLIVDQYTHGNSREALAFYEQVMRNIEEPSVTSRYVDRGVYSPNQAFRTIWSRKLGSDRVKIFQQRFDYRGKAYLTTLPQKPRDADHLNIMILGITLVTIKTGCQMLPLFEQEEKLRGLSNVTVAEKDVQEALGLLHKRVGDFCLVEGIKGGIITLKRTRPAYCELCDRIHEVENPYMFVSGGHLYYHCRRAPREKKMDLGPIKLEQIDRPKESLSQTQLREGITAEKPSLNIPYDAPVVISPQSSPPPIDHLKCLREIKRIPKPISSRSKKSKVGKTSEGKIGSVRTVEYPSDDLDWIAGAPQSDDFF